jgi:hypothetical protein
MGSVPGDPGSTLARQGCSSVNGCSRYENLNDLFMILGGRAEDAGGDTKSNKEGKSGGF